MTVVIEKDGLYLPSKLLGELRDAGVPVDGVTATENDADPPAVVAVQIICDDNASTKTIDTVCAAHDPTPAVQTVATSDDVNAVSAAIVEQNLADAGVAPEDVHPILTNLLAQTKAAVPFFEKYALDPSMTAKQWTDFQALPQATKDRLLYDLTRSIASIMRYLSGDLPTS